MGFALTFLRARGDRQLDADRDGLRRFLGSRGLRWAGGGPGYLVDEQGDVLVLDGSWSDLHIDSPDQAEPLTGGIWHATLGPSECAFVYDLCVAARWFILNPQGDPAVVVPGQVCRPEDLPESERRSAVWVDDPAELREALSGGFEQFLAYRRRVTGG